MEFVALATLLALIQVMAFQWRVGKGRNQFNVAAPATTGPETWERYNRVHLNTIENLIMLLPLMWICAWFFSPAAAATLGLAFVFARAWYSRLYLAEPSRRGPAVWLTGICLYLLTAAAAIGVALSAISNWKK